MTLNRIRHRAFSLIELIVVIAIVTVLLAILVPAVERSREKAMNVKCASNLHQVGLAIQVYATENHGQFPRTVYVPGAPLTFGTNPAAIDPFGPGGPAANDVTAAVFLILRAERVPPVLFTEPYTDELNDAPEPAADPRRRSNFTDFKHNLGYSFANPYPTAAAADAGYALSSRTPAGFAIAADLNPGVAGQNSRNHEKRGQNVMYADMHVVWATTPKCGLDGDDVFANKAGAVAGSPADAGDSVLLPTDK